VGWAQRDEQSICRECLEEAITQKVPVAKRLHYAEEYPCSKHGHPGMLSRRLQAWVRFFEAIAPYCTPQTLPIDLIGRICDEYNIPFVQAFERLTAIHKVVAYEDKHAKHRNRGGEEIPVSKRQNTEE
jgi:hypothetical protein